MSWLTPRVLLTLSIAAVILALGASVGYLRAELAGARSQVEQMQTAVARQKGEAAATLEAEKEKVRLAEALDRERVTQINDLGEKNAELTKKASTDLRSRTRAGGGRGLLDPHATGGCGCGSGGATKEEAPDGGKGEGDPTEAGRVLSESFERDLVTLVDEAQELNDAYGVCRAQLSTLTEPSE